MSAYKKWKYIHIVSLIILATWKNIQILIKITLLTLLILINKLQIYWDIKNNIWYKGRIKILLLWVQNRTDILVKINEEIKKIHFNSRTISSYPKKRKTKSTGTRNNIYSRYDVSFFVT